MTPITEEKERLADLRGLTIVGQPVDELSHSHKHLLYKFKTRTSCCGHETDFEVTHVRRKSFNCPNCSEGRYSKESNLYVVKISINEDSWLKVGIAKDVGVRVQGYGLPNGSHVETILVKPFKTGREAIKVEKALHKTLKGIRECSTKMKEILTSSGFTECYSIDHYKTIMKHIEELNL